MFFDVGGKKFLEFFYDCEEGFITYAEKNMSILKKKKKNERAITKKVYLHFPRQSSLQIQKNPFDTPPSSPFYHNSFGQK